MATLYEYKSIVREFPIGPEYQSAEAFLAPHAVEGWRLVCVAAVAGVYKSVWGEVFYLERDAKISEPLPSKEARS